jgi:hypothetical protein
MGARAVHPFLPQRVFGPGTTITFVYYVFYAILFLIFPSLTYFLPILSFV